MSHSLPASSARAKHCEARLCSLAHRLNAPLAFVSLQVTDLSPLSECTELSQLMLSSAPVVDLAPLRGCTGLVKLDISDTAVTSLSFIKKPSRYVIGTVLTIRVKNRLVLRNRKHQ